MAQQFTQPIARDGLRLSGTFKATAPHWEWKDELMTKRKRKLTPDDKAQKKRLREMYKTVFLNGKQKRIRREPTVDGLPVDEFIRRNADPIWLHQNEMWELIDQEDVQEISNNAPGTTN